MFKRSFAWKMMALGMGLCTLYIAYQIGTSQSELRELENRWGSMRGRLQGTLESNRKLGEELMQRRHAMMEGVFRPELEEAAGKIRGLKFLNPVSYQTMPKEELGAFIKAKIRVHYTPEEWRNAENAMKRLELIPRPFDLAQFFAGPMAEQVMAFYDPDDHVLYTFKEEEVNQAEAGMTLIHELVHTLQDQHFNLRKVSPVKKNNSDRELATTALIEGDATFFSGLLAQQRPPASSGRFDLTKEKSLENVPAYLRNTLYFPYTAGTRFVMALHAQGGQEAVDKAYTDPPKSSEQILHPEKYMGKVRDEPIPVIIDVQLSKEWRKVHENVLGELGIRSYLQTQLELPRCIQAAEGWGGDCLEIYERTGGAGGDRWLLVWKSLWDREEDAREFFDSMEARFMKKYHLGTAQVPADTVFFSESAQKENLTVRGKEVYFISSPDLSLIEKVLGYK